MTSDRKQLIDTHLRDIARGNVSAVAPLYDLIAPLIRHIAWKYLHNRDATDEFVQDFWADIRRIAEGYRFRFDAHAYLCKVATNRAISRFRELRRERAYICYVDYSTVSVPDADAADMELKWAVEQAMAELDQTERIVIQSTYFEEKTVRQIAADLHLSKSAVDRAKKRALEKLKRHLS